MKTSKSIIIAFVLLMAAQIASAYYCPSTGRWANRDPINEVGFKLSTAKPGQPFYLNEEKTLYVIVGNEPIALCDLLGLDDGLGPIRTPQNNNSGKDIEKNCKCILTCADKEALKRGLLGADTILQQQAGTTFDSWGAFVSALNASGVQQVGQTTGLLNGSLTDAAKKRLTDGQQCIVKYFESNAFTGKPGNHDHPQWSDSFGAISEYISEWIGAEDSRLQNAIAEISDAERMEGCPSYGPSHPKK